MAPSLYTSLLTTLTILQFCLADSDLLLERQAQCSANSDYFSSCSRCCSTDSDTLSGAGCYKLTDTTGGVAITYPWLCYTTAPGLIITVETESAKTYSSATVTRSSSSAAATQSTSSASGITICPDDGRCAAGTYCFESGGLWGCCTTGKNCTGIAGDCGEYGKSCGGYCIVDSDTCCADNESYCSNPYTCYTQTDGTQGCCEKGVDCPGDAGTAKATTRAAISSARTTSSSSSTTTTTSPTITTAPTTTTSRAVTTTGSGPLGPVIGRGSIHDSFLAGLGLLWQWLVTAAFLMM